MLNLLLAGVAQVKVCLAKFHDPTEEDSPSAEEGTEHVSTVAVTEPYLGAYSVFLQTFLQRVCFEPVCLATHSLGKPSLAKCLTVGDNMLL